MITTMPTSEIARLHEPRRQMCVPNRPATGLKKLVLRLRRVFEIPMGYEDETGFHYGPEPSPVMSSFEI
jgi:hypothetical protein